MDLVNQDKPLVSTVWQHVKTQELYVVKEQFRIGNELESWLDLRDNRDYSVMIRTDQLVQEYRKLDFQNTDTIAVL